MNGRHRRLHPGDQPPAVTLLQPNLPAVLLRQLPCDGQTQAGAVPRRAGGIEPGEGRKYRVELIGGNAGAAVKHGNTHPAG